MKKYLLKFIGAVIFVAIFLFLSDLAETSKEPSRRCKEVIDTGCEKLEKRNELY